MLKKWEDSLNYQRQANELELYGDYPEAMLFKKYIAPDIFKVIAKQLKPLGLKVVNKSTGYFEVSGFIKKTDGKIYYFSVGDVRRNGWIERILIREAESTMDYRGKRNIFIKVDEIAEFLE